MAPWFRPAVLPLQSLWEELYKGVNETFGRYPPGEMLPIGTTAPTSEVSFLDIPPRARGGGHEDSHVVHVQHFCEKPRCRS
jgi:hypothetical protein